MNEPLDIKTLIKDIDDAISRVYAKLNHATPPLDINRQECPECGGSGAGRRKTYWEHWKDKLLRTKQVKICRICHGKGII